MLLEKLILPLRGPQPECLWCRGVEPGRTPWPRPGRTRCARIETVRRRCSRRQSGQTGSCHGRSEASRVGLVRWRDVDVVAASGLALLDRTDRVALLLPVRRTRRSPPQWAWVPASATSQTGSWQDNPWSRQDPVLSCPLGNPKSPDSPILPRSVCLALRWLDSILEPKWARHGTIPDFGEHVWRSAARWAARCWARPMMRPRSGIVVSVWYWRNATCNVFQIKL